MLITVSFASHAKVIECNLLPVNFEEVKKQFEEWLYEEIDNCLYVKESLNIEVLDISVVIRFFEENYPESNVKIVNDNISTNEIAMTSPIIAL